MHLYLHLISMHISAWMLHLLLHNTWYYEHNHNYEWKNKKITVLQSDQHLHWPFTELSKTVEVFIRKIIMKNKHKKYKQHNNNEEIK